MIARQDGNRNTKNIHHYSLNLVLPESYDSKPIIRSTVKFDTTYMIIYSPINNLIGTKKNSNVLKSSSSSVE